jgi:flagellar biogenesis protein FliO
MEKFIFLLSESRAAEAADRLFGVFLTSGMPTPSTRIFFSIFQFFAATILVALLAWFATKKLVGARGMGKKAGNLNIVESLNVGGQAVVQLVKAGGKYLLIGVTRERVTLLAEIDKSEVTEPEPIDFKNLNTPFGKILSKYIQKDAPRDEENNE